MAGDALVAWTSYGQDASGAGVQGRLVSGGTEFQVNSQGQLHQSAPTVTTDGASKFLVVWVNTIQPQHSILSAQRYVTSDSNLDGVVDITSGEVQVVSAEASSRLTGAGASASAPSTEVASVPTVRVNTPAVPAAPSVAAAPAPAPAPVSTPASSQQAQSPTPQPSSTSAPRSLASARANTSGMASRLSPRSSTFAQQRSANVGRGMMQRIAQNRSIGRPSPSYGGRATQMARMPQRQSRVGSTSRSLPGMGMSSPQGVRSGLASTRVNSPRRTASNMMRGFNRGGNGSMAGSRSNPGQNRTVRASLQRGSAGRYNLSWNSQAGRRYVVQGSNDLKSWNNVGTARSGRGGPDTVQVGGTNAQRYYRVQQAN